MNDQIIAGLNCGYVSTSGLVVIYCWVPGYNTAWALTQYKDDILPV